MAMVEQDPVEVIPLVEERLSARKHRVETGRVRVRTVTEETESLVKDELMRGAIEVHRVVIDREIDTIPEPRQEGDTFILPVVSEELHIRKRLILKEEVHIKQIFSSENFEQPIKLKSQRAIVEREQAPKE